PKRFRDYGTCLRAVAQNGSVLQHVPEELRTEELCRTALDPDQFPHVDFPLRYEDYLRGVSVSGSLLARVPLEFRDAEMCAAAIAKQRDAATHVPPKALRQLADSAP